MSISQSAIIAAKDAEIAALRSEWVNAETSFGKERLIYCERIAALREAAKIGKLWVEADIETLKLEVAEDEIKGDLTISCGNSALRTINAALEMSGGAK